MMKLRLQSLDFLVFGGYIEKGFGVSKYRWDRGDATKIWGLGGFIVAIQRVCRWISFYEAHITELEGKLRQTMGKLSVDAADVGNLRKMPSDAVSKMHRAMEVSAVRKLLVSQL